MSPRIQQEVELQLQFLIQTSQKTEFHLDCELWPPSRHPGLCQLTPYIEEPYFRQQGKFLSKILLIFRNKIIVYTLCVIAGFSVFFIYSQISAWISSLKKH